MKNSKRGFTLVELCIVMALLAIVSTMATGFMVSFQKSAGNVTTNSNAVRDITNVNNFIESWVRNYDSTAYMISANLDKLEAYNAVESTTTQDTYTKGELAAELYINEDGTLVWEAADGTVTKSIKPEVIDELEFEYMSLKDSSGNALKINNVAVENNSVITCRIGYEGHTEVTNYAVFTATVRTRYSPKDRY